MNLFHTLAENALAGMYTPHSTHYISTILEGNANMYWHIHDCMSGSGTDVYLMEPKIQCLFFLFCGEMYEDKT